MNPRLQLAADDGSTAIKVTGLVNGRLKSFVTPNSFRQGWRNPPLKKTAKSRVFNYTVGNKKYTHDKTSENALETTHVDYQYSDLNLIGVHHALLETGIKPQPVELVVTLPITEYYRTCDNQRNEENIKRKQENLMRKIDLNEGDLFDIVDVKVYPESLPAVFSRPPELGCHEHTRTLVIDLGGTTLDGCVIVGEMDGISDILGNSKIGVSMVTRIAKQLLEEASTDTSDSVANIIIENRHDREMVRTYINDHSMIDRVLEGIDSAINDLGDLVVAEVKKLSKHPNQIFIVGGGAKLIEDAIKNAYPTISDKVYIPEKPQEALSEELCLNFLAEQTEANQEAV